MLKTVSSITNALGALNYKGTWNASTNSPALSSGAGTRGDYYVVSVAGSTTLDGISNWGVGDWATFNGSVWQRVEGGADLNGVNLSVSGTSTLSGLTASTALALDASKNVVSVTNTGSGNNVLATSPSLTTPAIGAATGTSIDVTGLSKALNFQLDANSGLNYDVKLVTTQGNGGANTVQVFWNGTYGAAAAGGCLGAYDRSGTYFAPATVIAGSDQYTIYGFIGVAP